MAKKTVSKSDIAVPMKWYEGEDPTPEELMFYGEVYKSIRVAQNDLLKTQKFIGNVLLSLDLVLDLTIETAATDFRNIYVNPKFWVLLDKDERLFVLAHETWHVALNHVLRRQGRIPEIWNIACDLEIHFVLLTERFKEPWVLQHDPAWKQHSAEQIYEELVKNLKVNPGPTGPGGQPGNGQGSQPDPNAQGNGGGNGLPDDNGVGNDKFGSTDKSFDDVIYDPPKPGKDGDSGDGSSNGPGDPNGQGGNPGPKVIRKGDWDPNDKGDDETGDDVRRKIDRAVLITQKQNGTVPGAVAGVIEEVNNPVVPWREQLFHWASVVTSSTGRRSYGRLSRRSWVYKVILPTTENRKLKVVVAMDTSGSCGPELKQFFSELVGIMDAFDDYELTVIQCDTRIQRVDKYTSENPYDPIEGWKVEGFGGTDFRPVFDYIEKEEICPAGLIFLTDGYGPAPDEEPDYPVLWVITEGGERPCPWGDAVSLTNDRVM